MKPAWPSIVNFRDFGGYPGADGRAVKRGLLYRGTALHDACDEDLDAMAGLGIGLVFDLRSRAEVSGRPDRLPSGAEYRREPGAVSMDETHREAEWLDWVALMDQLASSEDALREVEAFQVGVYAEMIRRPQAFAALAHEMLGAPDRPVYVHCSAGKDRTGVACAVVQRLLGVGDDDIMADYLESAKHRLADVGPVLERAAHYPPRVAAVIGLMASVAPERLQSAWREVDHAWGGWDGFVADGLSLTPDDVERLRESYLELAA